MGERALVSMPIWSWNRRRRMQKFQFPQNQYILLDETRHVVGAVLGKFAEIADGARAAHHVHPVMHGPNPQMDQLS